MGLDFEQGDWLQHTQSERERIIEELASHLAREHPDLFDSKNTNDRDAIEALVRSAVLTRKDLAGDEIEEVVQVIVGQATGYGVLQEFFLKNKEAEEITEVFINPAQAHPRVFYSKHGRPWPASKVYFKDNEEVLRYCQKICEDVGRPFTEDASIVDAWLKDGSRLAVIGFKTSPIGVAATIRKSPVSRPPMEMSKLVEYGTLPEFAADLIIDILVKGHANLGVFGRTDSGKTTFLRSMGQYIDPLERTFIAETSFEMYMPHLPNCINLVEVVYGDKSIVDMAQLCRTMNRNNPDRAIVGEIRSREIIAASQIASSTSGGFWTTGHAGDVHSLRTRIYGMFLDGGVHLPQEFLDEVVSSMFHFLIFLDKETITRDRSRTLMSIEEVTPAGCRTIIRFDREEFAKTRGKTRRWVYENAISPERLAMLAFRGGVVKPVYEGIKEKYIL